MKHSAIYGIWQCSWNKNMRTLTLEKTKNIAIGVVCPFLGDSLWLSYGFTYFKVMLSVFKQVYSGVNNSGLIMVLSQIQFHI